MDHLTPPVGADGAPPLAVPANGVGAVPAQREESMGAVPPQTPDTLNAVRAKHADASRSEAAPAPATAGAGTVSMQAADDFDGAWAALTSAAVGLAEGPVWRLGDESLVERVREFEGARARLEAHRLTLLRELDDRGVGGPGRGRLDGVLAGPGGAL